MTRNARKRAQRRATARTETVSDTPRRLVSNTTRKGLAGNRERPYSVVGTTAGQWTTAASHNTTRIWREER
ncbi:MAG TPA: hypothetical protein VFE08_14425 [Candidatus Sulfotelmatobacter sp.]|nr:hypothetical protein [Candidatus Sulfotelmatobacter sp.]